MLIKILKIKKKNLYLHTLIFFSVFFFWFLFNINERINIDLDNITDLSRYNSSFEFYTLDILLNEKLNSDPGYYFFTFFLNKFGINFEIFLFFSFYAYLLIIIKIFYKLTNLNNSSKINLILILISFFWMNSIIGVVLRQGLAFILLAYCLFLNRSDKKFKNYLVFSLAVLFHFSAIIFMPILFIKNFSKKKILLIDLILILVILFYSLGLIKFTSFILIDLISYLEIDPRAIQYSNHFTSGFSIFKLMAIIIPIFAIRMIIIKDLTSKEIFIKIYSFYCLAAIVGMMLSQQAYYDRILLYAWSISPIFLVFGFYSFIILVNRKNINHT